MDDGDPPQSTYYIRCFMGRRVRHAWLITLRLSLLKLYSGCTVLYGHDNKFLHKASQFLLHTPASLYTNTTGELGHEVAHTVLTTRDTVPPVPSGGVTQWAKSRERKGLSVRVPTEKAATL